MMVAIISTQSKFYRKAKVYRFILLKKRNKNKTDELWFNKLIFWIFIFEIVCVEMH